MIVRSKPPGGVATIRGVNLAAFETAVEAASSMPLRVHAR
jgi:hypothetical protein